MARRRRSRPPSGSPQSGPPESPLQRPGEGAGKGERAGSDSGARQDPPAADDAASAEEASKRPLFPVLPSLSRIMSVMMLVFGILAVGALFYRVMAGFFVPLFLATLLVVIFRPVHDWIYARCGNRARIAALGTTSLILAIVLVPILLIVIVAASQFTALLSRLNLASISEALERGRQRLALSLPHAERFRRLEEIVGTLHDTDDRTRLLRQIEQARGLVAFLQENVPGPPEAEGEAELVDRQLLEFGEAVRRAEAVTSGPAANASDLGEPAFEEPVSDEPALQEPQQADGQPADFDTGSSPAAGAPAVQQAGMSADAMSPRDDETLDPTLREGEGIGSAGEPPLPDALAAMESVEDRFDEQSVRVAASIRTWMHTLLGGSVWSQLRLIANPDESDFAELIGVARRSLQPRFIQLTSATGGFVIEIAIGLAVMMIATYYFLLDGPGMIRTLMRLSPLDDAYERRLLLEFDRTSRAVVLASVLSALAQGFLAAIAYSVVGFPSVVFLFLVTTLMGLVPFLGAASVWVPCVVWLAAVEGRLGAAIGLAIYGTLVISSVDNVIKMFVLHGRSQLHPLLALLSVLGGVAVFGPIGILVGPMVVVFLQTLLEILNHELASADRAGSGEEPDAGSSESIAESTAGAAAGS